MSENKPAIDIPTVPELFKPSAEDAVRINSGIVEVLKRMQARNLLPAVAKGGDLVTKPPLMHAFITRFKSNRDVGEGILINQNGQLAHDDQAELVCGFTPAQLERFLVITCAKRAYAAFGGETRGKIPAELNPYLAFSWQLGLLDVFVNKMHPSQFKELGDGMLLLRDRSHVEKLAPTPAADIRKVRAMVGERYHEMMAENPVAIRGVAICDEKAFQLFEKVIGERLWSFFGRDQQLVAELRGVDKKRLLSLGPHAPDLCVATFHVLEDVPTLILAPFMRSFAKVFGSPGRALLGDQQFAEDFLANVVTDFRELKADSNEAMDALEDAAVLKWNVIRPSLMEWVKLNKQTAKAE